MELNLGAFHVEEETVIELNDTLYLVEGTIWKLDLVTFSSEPCQRANPLSVASSGILGTMRGKPFVIAGTLFSWTSMPLLGEKSSRSASGPKMVLIVAWPLL